MSGKLIFTEYYHKKMALLFKKDRLVAAQVLPEEKQNRVGAVYIGKIKKIVPNLDACFVEIQNGEICFLPRKESYAPFLLNRTFDGRLLEGDELPVQVMREAQKTKQASVTAQISLSNPFFALNIDSTSRAGYSKKFSPEEKLLLQNTLTASGILTQTGVCQDGFPVKVSGIVRTQAREADQETLLKAFNRLKEELNSLLAVAIHRTCYTCLYEAPAPFAAVLDSLVYPDEFDEIVTDHTELYEELCAFCRERLPEKSVRLYQDASYPLHKLYSLETRLSEALSRRVWLKSGGYLVIEHTEALTAIDVNSGKNVGKGRDAGETAFRVNMEAAEEIALQLRLRNLSGMIIVDFINMKSAAYQNLLLQKLRSLVTKDRVKTKIVDMTALGLVEITRKKECRRLYEQLVNKEEGNSLCDL